MANTVVVRYKTKPDQADVNHQLVAAVFAELAGTEPGGVRYATMRLEDNTFVHIARIEAEPNPLASVGAFAEFQKKVRDRCEPGHEPQVAQSQLVGNYGVFADGFENN